MSDDESASQPAQKLTESNWAYLIGTIMGISVGTGFCITGFVLAILGLAGRIEWILETSSLKSRLTNASPGAMFAVMGMIILCWYKPKVVRETDFLPLAIEQRGTVRAEVKSIRELLFHVNNVVHTRANLLLLAESIFFAAIATLWKDENQSLKLLICVLGGVLTALLWYANGTLYVRSNFLTKKLKTKDPIYEEYIKAVPRFFTQSTLLLTHALPAVSLAAWVILFFVIRG